MIGALPFHVEIVEIIEIARRDYSTSGNPPIIQITTPHGAPM